MGQKPRSAVIAELTTVVLAGCVAALAAAACTGSISAPGQPPAGPGAGGAPGGGQGGTGLGGGNPGPTGPLVAARSPLRRLTRIEYDNTVRALLGDSSRPAQAFDVDTLADGFTNNADVQNVGTSLAQQYLAAAETLSVTATQNLNGFLGCNPTGNEEVCLRQFIPRFGQRAWRRPLVTEEIDHLMAVYTKGRVDFDVATGAQMVVQTMLVSPHFLYRVEMGQPTPAAADGTVPLTSWEIAARLSYFLTGSMPDDALFMAAERDALRTPEQIAAQANRVLTVGGTATLTLAQEQAQSRYAQFFTEWLHMINIEKLQRDKTLFPDFTTELAVQMKVETETFVKKTIFGGAGDLATLLTAPHTYASADVARLYGVTAPAGAPTKIDLDPRRRAGLLTQPAILATFAKADAPDPVHRGKFIWEGLLCGTVPPPPMNANITPPKITPGTTARQRFEEHRADPACATCHTVMDPIGLAFENYDALGRWRDNEGTLPIDASGKLEGTDVDGAFVGGVELAKKLATSKQAAACVVRQLFRFAFGRLESPMDEPTITDLAARFETSKRQMLNLAVSVTQTPAFRQLRVKN